MAMNLRCYSSTPLLRWNSGTGTVPEVIFRTAPQIGACPAIPILYLLRKVIFMSVVRVTNFFSFLCKVEARAEEGVPSLFYPDLPGRFTLFMHAGKFYSVHGC
jgi:hypothetical protein